MEEGCSRQSRSLGKGTGWQECRALGAAQAGHVKVAKAGRSPSGEAFLRDHSKGVTLWSRGDMGGFERVRWVKKGGSGKLWNVGKWKWPEIMTAEGH